MSRLQGVKIGGVIYDGSMIDCIGKGRGRIIGSNWVITEDGRNTENATAEIGKKGYVIINAEPLTRCGWKFDHWILQTWRTGMDPEHPLEATSTECEHTIVVPSVELEDEWVFVFCAPVFIHEGTNKIMRSSNGIDIIRAVNKAGLTKILVDN